MRARPAAQAPLEGVVGWRVARLRAAGFPEQIAEKVAREGAYDLHGLLELIDRGCPPELAVRILAPLQVGERHR